MDSGVIQTGKKARESGIELIKIISVFFIVVCHVCHTLGQKPEILSEFASFMINSDQATANPQFLMVVFFRYIGNVGNDIFLASSFWFLCESKRMNSQKVFTMLMDVWLISVIFLAVYAALGEKLSAEMLIRCIFPVISGNNWFVSCYVLIYLIHPFLNMVMDGISQKLHLLICIVSLFLYSGIVFLLPNRLYSSPFIQAVVLYFVIGYMKKYMENRCSQTNKNRLLLAWGVCGIVFTVILTDLLGLRFSVFKDLMLRWEVNNNPFILMTALALFFLFRQKTFVNTKINAVSSLSLFIYVFHENILFRNFTRVRIWGFLIERFGYDWILLSVFGYSLALFIVSVMVSWIYQLSLHKAVVWMARKADRAICEFLDHLTEKTMRIR